MQIQPTTGPKVGSYSWNLIKSKSCLGTLAGFLISVISLPFIASSGRTATGEESAFKTRTTNHSRVITDTDRNLIDRLRETNETRDKRAQEIEWVKTIWPTIQPRLIKMYEAEREDNKLIREGKITENERKVKIFYAEFVLPGQLADDEGSELNLHVVKMFDDVQPDGSVLRTYINEHWRDYNGHLLPSEVNRFRVQVFKGPLNKPGAENLFVTDLIESFWFNNFDGSKRTNPDDNKYPILFRQHKFKGLNQTTKKNDRYQVQVDVTSPSTCIKCHTSNLNFNLTEPIFAKKPTNFGAITPDEMFDADYKNHNGYKKYTEYLYEQTKGGKLSKAYVDNVAIALGHPTIMENSSFIEALQENNILWLDGDTPEISYDSRTDGFRYKDNGIIWIKEAYKHFGPATYLGEGWGLKDIEVSPY